MLFNIILSLFLKNAALLHSAFLTILLHWLEKQTNLYKMPILEKLEVHSF